MLDFKSVLENDHRCGVLLQETSAAHKVSSAHFLYLFDHASQLRKLIPDPKRLRSFKTKALPSFYIGSPNTASMKTNFPLFLCYGFAQIGSNPWTWMKSCQRQFLQWLTLITLPTNFRDTLIISLCLKSDLNFTERLIRVIFHIAIKSN